MCIRDSGEESALLESLEGKRGIPRIRPPFPAVVGAFQCPTVLNNVETYCAVPAILRDGGAAFAALGIPKAGGTKMTCLTGHINKPGVYELKLGFPVKQMCIRDSFISLEDMLDLGVTGPMLRAAGLKIDARKDEPYTSYEKFDFEVPTRTENDVFARYQVRVEEMRQSARIVQQALEGMPAGPWKADAPHAVSYTHLDVYKRQSWRRPLCRWSAPQQP